METKIIFINTKKSIVLLLVLCSFALGLDVIGYNAAVSSTPTDSGQLADNILPSADYDSNWLAYESSAVDIIFDLGENVNLSSCNVHYFVGDYEGTSFSLESVTIQTSKNGVLFTPQGTFDDFESSGGAQTSMCGFSAVSARYVKLSLTSNTDWIRLGEVSFFKTNEVSYVSNIAVPVDPNEPVENAGILFDNIRPRWSLEEAFAIYTDVANETITLDFNFNGLRQINTIGLYYATWHQWLSRVPESAVFTFSNDGINYGSSVDITPYLTDLGGQTNNITVPISEIEARYARVDIELNSTNFRLGEVILEGPDSEPTYKISPDTPTHYKNNDRGNTLLDGFLYADASNTGYNSEWVGWDLSSTTYAEIEFDLKKVTDVSFIAFTHPVYYPPENFEFSFSNDGISYSEPVHKEGLSRVAETRTETSTVELSESFRYVKVRIDKGDAPLLYLSEVEFYKPGEDIAYYIDESTPTNHNYIDDTGRDLINGIKGAYDWSDPDWVMWESSESVPNAVIMFDMGTETVFRNVAITYGHGAGSATQAPENIEVSFSPDPNDLNFGDSVVLEGFYHGDTSGVYTSLFDLDATVARCIKIQVNPRYYDTDPPGKWIMLSEFGFNLMNTDMNFDGTLDIEDIVLLGSEWTYKQSDLPLNEALKYDINSDGKVDLGDFSIMSSEWNDTVELYVAPTAQGTGSGLTPLDAAAYDDQDWRLNIKSLLANNDVTLWFLDGEYTCAGNTIYFNGFGEDDYHLTISGASETGVIMNGTASTKFDINGSKNITVKNFNFTGDIDSYALRITNGSSNITVESCTFKDLSEVDYGAIGISLGSSDITVNNCVFERVGYDDHAHMFYIAHNADNVNISNCHFEDCSGSYVRFRDDCDYGTVANSTFNCTGQYLGADTTMYIQMALFNDEDPGDEVFATNYTISGNEFTFYPTSTRREGMVFHHNGYNPDGWNYLMTAQEGAILEGSDSEAKKTLLLDNCGIDIDSVVVSNNTWNNVDKKLVYESRALYGATSAGWEGAADISDVLD